MNIIILPYHDWRKILLEGARTRDAHFIEALRRHHKVNKVLIINRPYTPLELYLKKKNIPVSGDILLHEKGGKLIKIDDKTFITDFESYDIINHARFRRKWYSKAYAATKFVAFQRKSIEKLGLREDDTLILNQNILSAPLCSKLGKMPLFFDAWDNFLLMPGLSDLRETLTTNYQLLSKQARQWYTNSQQNIAYFHDTFGPKNIKLLKNGVDFSLFKKNYEIPNDLEGLQRPIVGFGGKVTHLFDADLYRHLIERNPDKSFVLIGQILDKAVFNSIGNHPNFYYLGDKHYNQYASYITNFDIGIIPYKIGKSQHGGDSIKVYEYLAAGIKVVGTNDNGIENHGEFLYIAHTKEQFHDMIQEVKSNREPFCVDNHSWEAKATEIVNDFQKI
ncbi:glycosyltransferase [Pontibacter mangrovi]|uniref:Glycosyltransferase family 1 protein n=1 Tax=Pontibacter mangrovi TaxID=2589816 RepID=A0A501W940_9BACT|nr:glycosyltransferase family 1 protein [Pontibacter mangrovi]TPE46129.1 glycosyltransferase family 1 protein [Pontibacter mangrovi]